MIPNKIDPIISIKAALLSGFAKLGVTPGGGWSAGIYLYMLGSNIVVEKYGENNEGERQDRAWQRPRSAEETREFLNQGEDKIQTCDPAF